MANLLKIKILYHQRKINNTPEGVYLSHFEVTLDFSPSECSFERGKKTPLGVPFILLLLVHEICLQLRKTTKSAKPSILVDYTASP